MFEEEFFFQLIFLGWKRFDSVILVRVEIRRLSFRAVDMLGSGIIKGMNILTNEKKKF